MKNVPDDLLIRIVRAIKENKQAEELKYVINLINDWGNTKVNMDLVRRVVILHFLERDQLVPKDVIWLTQAEKARKRLWGVSQIEPSSEFLIAVLIIHCCEMKFSNHRQRTLDTHKLYRRIWEGLHISSEIKELGEVLFREAESQTLAGAA